MTLSAFHKQISNENELADTSGRQQGSRATEVHSPKPEGGLRGPANWFSWNCASSVAGAVVGGLSIVARVARLIWTLPVVFSHLNLQSVAYWIIDMWGGAEKLNAFAYQALRLQHITENLGYYAFSTAFAAADRVIHAVIDLAQPAAAASSGSGMPSPVPAC